MATGDGRGIHAKEVTTLLAVPSPPVQANVAHEHGRPIVLVVF